MSVQVTVAATGTQVCELDWTSMSAAAVFGSIGISLIGPAGDLVGSVPAGELLAACQVALATGTPALHARPAVDGRPSPVMLEAVYGEPLAFLLAGAHLIDAGTDSDWMVDRVRQLADLATEALRLGSDVIWS